MVHMDRISEEPTINHSINDTNNNGDESSDVDHSQLEHSHSADEKPIEFANDTTNNIVLYPFAHQVGGHTQLLTLDKSTLCKPLVPRELLFYLNVPKELIGFIPSYKGVVQIRRTGQGGVHQPVVYQPLRSPKSPFASKCKPGSSCTLPAKMAPRHATADLCGFPFELKVQIRPCSDEKTLRMNLSQDNLLRADYISRPNEKYLLLLENVASKYQLPCILDLKMGTRQHGDDASEEKRHRQIAKCQASTSASLGVRLCGMQVYQVDHGGFLWYDKYCGRKMDEEGLKRALQEYFRIGPQLNETTIDAVINRLKLLSRAVESSQSYRFYGTSLLIIHEGCTSSRSNTKKCSVDVRLIDFAHTICDYSNTNNGRSSSSPSVLKSNSAEQLSTKSTGSLLSNQAESPTKATNNPDQQSRSGACPVSSAGDCVQSNCSLQTVEQRGPSCELDRENYQPSGKETVAVAVAANADSAMDTHLAQGAGRASCDAINRPQLEQQQQQQQQLGQPVDRLRSVDGNSRETTLRPPASAQQVGGNLTENLIQYHQNHLIGDNDPKSSLLGHEQEIKALQQEQEQPLAPPPQQQQDLQQRQLASSTPTSPPSLGNRKISKTSIGPDRGLLFGLENLMRLLDDLKSETLITSC